MTHGDTAGAQRRHDETPGRARRGLERLDDIDYPAYTTGQAADMLDVQQAFLRALDRGGVVSPQRSGGGHRRYSRRQLRSAARLRELLDEGHSQASAARILELEHRIEAMQSALDAARDRINDLSGRSGRARQPAQHDGDTTGE